MKVKNIHFVNVVPTLPVYEMKDGSIRVPFPDGKTKELRWLSKDEAVKFATHIDKAKTVKDNESLTVLFDLITKEIKK